MVAGSHSASRASARSAAHSAALISPSMASKLLAEFALMRRRDTEVVGTVLPKLTEREVEVLGLVARGMGNREIGRMLFISENTVKNHVRNILEKLQLHTRMEAAMYAVQQNLIHPPNQ
jgi:two-component system NarL family response regulator